MWFAVPPLGWICNPVVQKWMMIRHGNLFEGMKGVKFMGEVNILKANRNDLGTILQLQKDGFRSEAEMYNDFTIPPLQQDLESLENEYRGHPML